MHPRSLRLFELFYLGSLLVGIANFALNRSHFEGQLAADPATAQMGGNFLFVTFVLSMGLSIAFWGLIVFRRSKIAKWVLTVLSVLGVVLLPASLAATPAGVAVFSIASALMQLAAITMLFKPDARAWFDRSDTDARS